MMNRNFCHTILVLGMASAGTASANATFYQGDNFGGREFTVSQTVSNFDRTGFNDRARSAVVTSGQWEICVDAEFSGNCQVLGPGRYPDLGGFAGRVSSARPVSSASAHVRGEYRSRQGGGARATLYEGRNLSGQSFDLGSGTMANLDGTGFNDRASSLRVDSGYWVFCSDANFGGECRTFGPGDYATLPSGLNNMISSGRRISDDYPYSQSPAWQR
jgi:Beta/Gamma crystallin